MTTVSQHGAVNALGAPINAAIGTNDSIEARIGAAITPQPNGCWLYDERRDEYIHLGIGALHRWVYETLVGPIPDGHHLHHECKQPACCNPEHLTPLLPEDHRDRHRRRKPRLSSW